MRQSISDEVSSTSSNTQDRDLTPQSETTSIRSVLPTARYFSGDDIIFSGISSSVQTTSEGQLVVYRIGQDDPNELIAEALARGAAGILTEQILPCPLPQCVVGDVDGALAKLHAFELDRPDRRLLTIGVYGSAGKTCTTLLLAQLLRSIGLRSSYQTDLGESDGIVQETPSTVPLHSSGLIRWLSDSCDAQAQSALIEISEQDAKYGRYDAIEFDVIVLTGNIADHDGRGDELNGDFGPTGMSSLLDRLTTSGVVIAPADSPSVVRSARDTGKKVITYGIKRNADVSVKIIDQETTMTTLLMTHESVTAAMETSLCGSSMASNHAAAATLGILLNQPLEEVVEHLGALRQIPGRLQTLPAMQHADVILDTANTPEQIATALRSARSMRAPGGRLWCVMAIDPSDSPLHLALNGGHAERFADKPIVTCFDGKKDHFLKASHAVLDGVQKCAMIRLVADSKRAIQWAVDEANPQDTILVLGGVSRERASQQRKQIENLEKWVESCRENNEQNEEQSIAPPVGPAVIPFIFKP